MGMSTIQSYMVTIIVLLWLFTTVVMGHIPYLNVWVGPGSKVTHNKASNNVTEQNCQCHFIAYFGFTSLNFIFFSRISEWRDCTVVRNFSPGSSGTFISEYEELIFRWSFLSTQQWSSTEQYHPGNEIVLVIQWNN